MAWIELRIAEAVYLVYDAPAVMHMLHCADMKCSEVCTAHWGGKYILAIQNT